jgi:hypothetical protein
MASVSHTQPELEPRILTMPELSQDSSLLHDVVAFINQEYLTHAKFEFGIRFSKDTMFVEENGPAGLCAIITSKGSIIATASFRKWRPDRHSEVDNLFEVPSAFIRNR